MRSIAFILTLFFISAAFSQENYEIQVYSSPTMTKGSTIFELHSNYTFSGTRMKTEGVTPTNHSLHETLEVTHGIGENFELGFYLFTNYTSGFGYKVIGTHIRPRITAPQKWNWPVGVSLSTEVGYQSRYYSEDTWNVEIRPIVDKQAGRFYFSL